MNINWAFNHLDITVRTGNANTHQQSQFIIGGTTADNTLTVTIANKSDNDFALTASQCLTIDLTDFIGASDIEKITMSNVPSDLNHITLEDAVEGWQMEAYAVPTGQGSNTAELLCISDPDGLTVAAQKSVSFSLTDITVAATPVPPTNGTTGNIRISVFDTKSAGGAPTTPVVFSPLSLIFYKYLIGTGDPTPVNGKDFNQYVGALYVFGVKSGDKNTSPDVEMTAPNQREYKLNYTGSDLAWTAGSEPEIRFNFSASAKPQAGNISTLNALTNFKLTVSESAQKYWSAYTDLGTQVPSLYVKPAPGITSIPKSAFPLTLTIDYGELYLDDTLVSGSDLPQTTISIAFRNFNGYSPITLPINVYTNYAPYIAEFQNTPVWPLVSPASFTLKWNVLNPTLGPVFKDNPNVKVAANSIKSLSLTTNTSKTLIAATVKPAFQMTQKVNMTVFSCVQHALQWQDQWQFDFENDLVIILTPPDGAGNRSVQAIDISTGATKSSANVGAKFYQLGQGTRGKIPLMGMSLESPPTYESGSLDYFDSLDGSITSVYPGSRTPTPVGQGSGYLPFPSLLAWDSLDEELFFALIMPPDITCGYFRGGLIRPRSNPLADQINYFDTDVSFEQLALGHLYIVFTGRNLQGVDLQWTLYDVYKAKSLDSTGLNIPGFGSTNALIKGNTLVSASELTVSSIPLPTDANPVATPILTLDASICSSISLVTVCTSTSSGIDYWIMATDNNKLVVWSEGHVIYEVQYPSAITRLESDRVSKVVTFYAPGVTRYEFGW